MKKSLSESVAIALVLVTTVGVVAASLAYRERTKPEIELLARSPEKGNWFPQSVSVKKGQDVTLVIRNDDAVTHGFYLPAFDVTVREIKAGKSEVVKFRPDQAGAFGFYCNVWCGDYHMKMRGTLIVEE